MINTLTILGGQNKLGVPEPVDKVEIAMGDVISIVGPTGSGKTTLISDIELFANRNTPSRRAVMVNGQLPQRGASRHPADHPIALITQHTHFLSDLPVASFLTIHAEVRGGSDTQALVQETLDFANRLTGEPIDPAVAMTELSGGQTRALLIGDAVVIGNAPIILLDEIENAGIHRTRALDLLRQYRKIFIFVTHDPRIALLSDFRVVLKSGAMTQVIATSAEEKRVVEEIKKMDDLLLEFRGHIRDGKQLTEELLTTRLREMGYLS